MKNYLTNLFNSSIYRHALRLVIVLLCLTCSIVSEANNSGTLWVYPEGCPTGHGKVYVSWDNNVHQDSWNYRGCETDEDHKEGGDSSGKTGQSASSHTWYLYNLPDEGYYHEGWKYNGTFVSEHIEPKIAYSVTQSLSSSNPSYKYYAAFRAYYLMTLYGYDAENSQFETVPLGGEEKRWDVVYADNLTLSHNQTAFTKKYKIELNHSDVDKTKIEVRSDTYDVKLQIDGDDIELIVSQKEDINETIQGSVTLFVNGEWNKEKEVGNADEGKGIVATLHLIVSNKQIYVTLNPAEDLTGWYEYTQGTTGPTKKFPVTTLPINKEIRTASDLMFTFFPQPHDGYKFDKWIITDAQGNTTETATETLSPDLKGGESITPVFVASDRAIFIVKSEPNVEYIDLQKALDHARALSSDNKDNKVVVVKQQGRLVTSEYTIPSGVTLLVPGEDTYTSQARELDKNDFEDFNIRYTLPTVFCHLKVDGNTTFKVDGNISLYGKLSANQYCQGKVNNCGMMTLGKNCSITVNNGGRLYAYGFIQGDPSSHITMEDGSIAYEVFHFRDWIGGDDASTAASAGVFPIGQYYIQNIEVPITFKHGAKEWLTTAIIAGSSFLASTYVSDALFISSINEDGFLKIDPNTTLTKEYIPSTDRLKFTFQGVESDPSSSQLGHLKLEFTSSIKFNSSSMVMPIQNNMTISLRNTQFKCSSGVAFMPGSILDIAEDASVHILSDAKVYVYDNGARKLNVSGNQGYWGIGAEIYPNWQGRPGDIRGHGTSDAKVLVNGTITVDGELYTVKGDFADEDTTAPEGGANITSDGGGKVIVNKIVSTTNATKQFSKEHKICNIPLTSPNLLLRNDMTKGAASAYTSVSSTGTYTYNRYDGTWHKQEEDMPDAITNIALHDNNGNKIERFMVTLPTEGEQSGWLYVHFEEGTNYNNFGYSYDTENSNGFTLTPGNAVLDDVNNILKVPVTYTPNIHGEHSLKVQITCGDNPTVDDKTPSFTLLAKEDYTPIFTAPTSLHIFGRIGQDNFVELPITPGVDNVTTTSKDDIKWTYTLSPTNTPFDFIYGDDDATSGAQVKFKPTTESKASVDLKLTATYQGNLAPDGGVSATVTVKLTGNGLKIANTMEFNNVGTITTSNTDPFNLLRNVNSIGALTCKIVDGETKIQVPNNAPYTDNEIVQIEYTTIDGKGNYIITPKGKMGEVKLEISQASTDTYEDKTITTILYVATAPISFDGDVCVETMDHFQTLTSGLSNVEYNAENSQIQFKVGEDNMTPYWIAQFLNKPGTMTFKPNGDGYWAVQESENGTDWSEIIWWTQLPSDTPTRVVLQPTSRYVKISYDKLDEMGYITELCIHPLTVHAETTKMYVPVVKGVVQSTSVVFTHSLQSIDVNIAKPDGWPELTKHSTTKDVSGKYYQTTVTISGGTDVQEQNNAYTIIATQGEGEDMESAEVKIGTYIFPKPLQMYSNKWVTDDEIPNVNDYDESEHYYWYMTDSKNVKWDADRKNLVFMQPCTAENKDRQVTFGYYGLPNEVRFQSLSTDWTFKESKNGTDWNNPEGDMLMKELEGGEYLITQPIRYDSKYVCITCKNTDSNTNKEVLLSNLSIEGFPSAVPSSNEVVVSKSGSTQGNPSATFTIHVMNLANMKLNLDNNSDFDLYYGNADSQPNKIENYPCALMKDQYPFLQMNEQGNITIKVVWKANNKMVSEGRITILNGDVNVGDGKDATKAELASVRIVGKKNDITRDDANTGIWTGVPTTYSLKGSFEPYTHHQVNVRNAFDTISTDEGGGNALFNYLVIYGETTTTKGGNIITSPDSEKPSNAKTPYYIYMRNNDGKSYSFIQAVENANVGTKANLSNISHFEEFNVDGVKYYAINPKPGEELSIYMTGFCPYATTGSTKDDEGVWYFRGEKGDKLHIYLDSCHIYSRNKSFDGHNTQKYDPNAPTCEGDVVQGSGGVLVFENVVDPDEQDNLASFEVTIHTREHNVLKSNRGAYYQIAAYQAAQISSPVQIRLGGAVDFEIARTTLDFDDLWPVGGGKKERTNGFLALKKLANYAPSIDLGNTNTVVNFRGGQVELENSTVQSPNYKTTMAISHRSGKFGNIHLPLAFGIGTDDVGGTVHFYDGTVTVERMEVENKAYRVFYLMDTLSDGTESEYTSCLRLPQNTYVHGGSHCMMRACSHVTSKGGAPKDGPDGELLGRYVYTEEDGYSQEVSGTGIGPHYLATPINFPGTLQKKDGTTLSSYYKSNPNYKKDPTDSEGRYGLESITPDKDGNLSFWIPGGYVEGVDPEKDGLITFWKTCMTEIEAGVANVTGRIGGTTAVELNEQITNLLYCQLDRNIYNIINEHTVINNDERQYNYAAPVVDPTGLLEGEDKYKRITPTYVGDSTQHSIVSEDDYEVSNRIYYITTAKADKWMNFTMPFDVDTIWVVETFSEAKIEEFFKKINKTAEEKTEDETDMLATLRFQARHNADYAAFFGVAMAIGDVTKSFDDFHDGFIDWAKNTADVAQGPFTEENKYNLRGKYPLTHYDGTNFTSSHFYLYHNTGDWNLSKDQYTTKWEVVPPVEENEPIMKKGETYSMLFPYCLGCDVQLDEDNQLVVDEDGFPITIEHDERPYWDYWSGKLLIFESVEGPHTVRGSNFVNKTQDAAEEWLFDVEYSDTKAVLTGNSTFTVMNTADYAAELRDKIYTYQDYTYNERFVPLSPDIITGQYPLLTPTTTFMINGASTKPKLITREGKVVYGNGNNNGTTTGGNIPTVGGGNDLFITEASMGINIAVAAPQLVRVMSATGAVIYSGMVQTSVDVALPTNGVYIVTGENEVQKILF